MFSGRCCMLFQKYTLRHLLTMLLQAGVKWRAHFFLYCAFLLQAWYLIDSIWNHKVFRLIPCPTIKDSKLSSFFVKWKREMHLRISIEIPRKRSMHFNWYSHFPLPFHHYNPLHQATPLSTFHSKYSPVSVSTPLDSSTNLPPLQLHLNSSFSPLVPFPSD